MLVKRAPAFVVGSDETQATFFPNSDLAAGSLLQPPVITSDGGGNGVTLSIPENSVAVTTVTATDPDSQSGLTYSISMQGGNDRTRFAIDATSGALRFVIARDYETRIDAYADNVYDVNVKVTDSSGLSDTQSIAVTITNVPGVTLTGDDSVNRLNGTDEDDTLTGLDGDDVLRGYVAPDSLYGGGGSDHLFGGPGADVLDGGAGFDYVRYDYAAGSVTVDLYGLLRTTGEAYGDAFVSVEGVFGSAFTDYLKGDEDANVLVGGGGDDRLSGRGGADTVRGGDGNDHVGGEHGNDSISGDAGDDYLNGGTGNDALYGGAGADLLDGSVDFDYARYDFAPAGVTVNMADPRENTGDAAGDTYLSIEAIIGSGFADRLIGNAGANVLEGEGGNDVLIGAAGADTLIGGAGADRFDYNASGGGVDTIRDFLAGGGDQLDVKDVLIGYIPNVSNIHNYVRASGTTSATISVNSDGIGGDFVALAVLQNVARTATFVDDMLAGGNLIVS